MSGWPFALALALLYLAASAMYSGSETALYTLSRPRLDLRLRAGVRRARWVRWLTERDATVLITILIGNNLVLELLTRHTYATLDGRRGPGGIATELLVSAILIPIVFLLGEILPKEFSRRRPLAVLELSAPLIAVSRFLFWPLERVIWIVAIALERISGARRQDLARRPGREAVLRLVQEGARAGALPPRAERLVRNALELRRIPVTVAMIPWSQVQTVGLELAPGDLRAAVLDSPFTRLPVIEPQGSVKGYLHQLEVLREPERPAAELLRPLPAIPADTPVDRALSRLRLLGQRAALVGDPAAPVGLVTLKDLLEEISGDLGDW